MNLELEDRIKGLESIIHGLYQNNSLLQYMSFNLHKEPYNLFNNIGLYWIWINIMGIQILDFYKTVGKHEKFSFIKLLNFSKELKVIADFELLEKKTKQFIESYNNTKFEIVRSKYLAHQDLNAPEIRTDLNSIESLTQEIIALFELYIKEFGYKKNEISKRIIDSINEIFTTVNEYDKLKSYLIASRIKGIDKVAISYLKEITNSNF